MLTSPHEYGQRVRRSKSRAERTINKAIEDAIGQFKEATGLEVRDVVVETRAVTTAAGGHTILDADVELVVDVPGRGKTLE